MIHDAENERFILSSGRVLAGFNNSIVGIAPDDRGLYGGYDDRVLYGDVPDDPMRDDDALTAEERREIGDYMIALWSKWASPPA